MTRFPRMLPALLVGSAVFTTVAFAQNTPAPDDSALVASAEPASAPNNPVVPANAASNARSSLMLPVATPLRMKLNTSISTAYSRPGQRFTATLSQPVTVDNEVVIPAGAEVRGIVQRATGSRRFAGKPAILLKPDTLVLSDGRQLAIASTVVDTAAPGTLDVDDEGRIRGASPNPMNKVETIALGGTGLVTGALIAGPQGMLIGAASGVGLALGHAMIKHRDLTLPSGTEVIVQLDRPATLSDSAAQ